jgi:pimeloyl-ACP methyl ester carboxylesterase
MAQCGGSGCSGRGRLARNVVVTTSVFIACNNLFFWFKNQAYKRKAKKHFGLDTTTRTYIGTGLSANLPPQYPRIVFFISGVDSFASDFEDFIETLPPDIPTVCPRAIGWDFENSGFLKTTSWNEVFVYYEDVYKLVSEIAVKVDIVAHSNGCNIAALLADRHSVNNLILLAPNFSNPPQFKFVKAIFLSSFGKALEFLFPMLPFASENALHWRNTPRNPSKYINRGTVPFRSVVQQWRLQDAVTRTGMWRVKHIHFAQDERDCILDTPQKQIDIIKSHIDDNTLQTHVSPQLTHDMIKVGTINSWLRPILTEMDWVQTS